MLEEVALNLQKLYPHVVFVGFRYCNVYGPREYHKGSRATMIYQFARQMQAGNPRIFCYGEQKRDYIYVKDVVRANMLASIASESCVVNCCSGKATTFNRLVELLNDTLKLNGSPEYIANPYEDNYQAYTECDMTLAREKIGFIPEYSIEDGIYDYYKSGFLLKG